MKNQIKKLLLVLCIITCALGMTACGKAKETLDYDEQEVKAISEVMVTLISSRTAEQVPQFMELDPSEVEELFKNQIGFLVDGAAFQSGLENYSKARADMGELKEITGYTFKQEADRVVVNAAVAGEKKNASVELILDKKMKVTSISTNVSYTFGELMKKAGLNTLMGMGTVFIVLILMSFIISLFKFIPDLQKKFSKEKKEEAVVKAADQVITQIAEKEELSDDSELVAVISAAVAAYESANGGSAEGFVVRSIRKSNKWRRA